MSTICFKTDKFLKIRQTMFCKERDFAHEFKYPDGWENGGMRKAISAFVQDLRTANIRAFNERYEDENEPNEILPALMVTPYPTSIHLLKALQSIDYNIDDQNVNGCADRLHEIIYGLMYKIISELPAYDKADVWM